jgi:hypothetical protein
VIKLGAEEAPLDLVVVPFEPLTPGSGGSVVEKKEKLSVAIKERLSKDELETLRHRLAGKLVAVTVVFLSWKGFS